MNHVSTPQKLHKKRRHKSSRRVGAHNNNSSSRINTANIFPDGRTALTSPSNMNFGVSFQEQTFGAQSKFNMDLCMDPELPQRLINPSPLYYILSCLGILLIYAAADIYYGMTLSIPGLHDDLFILVGWLLHFAGAAALLIAILILIIARIPFSTGNLLTTFFSLLLFVAASVLHTSRLIASDAIKPFATSVHTSLQISWTGNLFLYSYFSYLLYHSPHALTTLATNKDTNNHNLLLQLREIETRNRSIQSTLDELEQDYAAVLTINHHDDYATDQNEHAEGAEMKQSNNNHPPLTPATSTLQPSSLPQINGALSNIQSDMEA
jgi:hypothetical protein